MKIILWLLAILTIILAFTFTPNFYVKKSILFENNQPNEISTEQPISDYNDKDIQIETESGFNNNDTIKNTKQNSELQEMKSVQSDTVKNGIEIE